MKNITVMTLQEKVGKAIIKLRKERGMSQETFAFESGIDRRYMSDIENGKRNISLDILERIADKLNIRLSEFFLQVEKVRE
jgi:transcriptional regulator with XRE-family HTH domain